ncbi:MAG: hypothetical protein AB1407_07560 [Spirochaetota bacterium]
MRSTVALGVGSGRHAIVESHRIGSIEHHSVVVGVVGEGLRPHFHHRLVQGAEQIPDHLLAFFGIVSSTEQLLEKVAGNKGEGKKDNRQDPDPKQRGGNRRL